MTQFKLIMLSAMYENGGNTTHRFLDGHPRLLVYPFESQVGTGYATDQFTSLVPIRYRWPEFPSRVAPEDAYEMFWDEELKTLLRVPGRSKFQGCGLELVEAERKARFAAIAADAPANRARLVQAYFQSTFEAWRNCHRSGEETTHVGYNPVQVIDTDKILEDFPDGHVIHVVRNPWSGFADTCKRPFPLSLKRYVWLWNLSQHLALTYQQKYAGQFHLVRFEDLVASPERTLSKLMAELGLPMAEQCLQPSFNGRRLDQVHPWGTIETPTTEKNLDTARLLDAEQRARVRTEAAVMLPHFGYDELYAEHLAK